MITKNYIKMCEKAEEMQKLCKYRMGDWFLFPKGLWVLNGDIDGKFLYPWLPTQEQLQEILYDHYQLNTNIKDLTIGDSISKYMIAGFSDFVSYSALVIFNELWLAFVMYEKYNKIWTGKDWVKYGKG